MTWGHLLADQLDFYVQAHLLPRLEGLSEAEYRWVPDGPAHDVGRQAVTTIEWRLTHLAVDNLGTRVNAYFAAPPDPGVDMFDPALRPPAPSSATEAVELLTQMHEQWCEGVASLTDAQLLAPLGPVGGPFAEDPMAALVLHVSREAMHHGGEIGLMRDLHAARSGRS